MSRGAIHEAVAAAIEPGRIGVACSGGADSVALVDAALELAGDRVVVITIDHGLHAASARIAGEVAAWAHGRGAAAIVERVVVAPRASLEAAARTARYAAFARIAEAHDLATVMTGHTARDQAETVLMRLLRGTGPAGLAAIPARRGRFVRPLLAIARPAIDAYVAGRGLPTWSDPMNDDLAITRVRVRMEILPLLRRENPQLDAALVRLAASAAEWLEVIDAIAAPLGRFPIDCAALARQPAAIRKRAVAIALDAAELDHDAVHLEAIDALVTAPTRGTAHTDVPGARLARTYDSLDRVRGASAATPIVVPAGYAVRGWQAGDRMQPARLAGHSRKLSDLYGDAKIPRTAREIARVVVRDRDGVIVWAEHLGIAHASTLLDEEREFFQAITTPTPT